MVRARSVLLAPGVPVFLQSCYNHCRGIKQGKRVLGSVLICPWDGGESRKCCQGALTLVAFQQQNLLQFAHLIRMLERFGWLVPIAALKEAR